MLGEVLKNLSDKWNVTYFAYFKENKFNLLDIVLTTCLATFMSTIMFFKVMYSIALYHHDVRMSNEVQIIFSMMMQRNVYFHVI